MPWKRIGGVEVWFHEFLTSALDGGEWSTSRPGRFIPGVRASGSYWIGGWVGSSAGLLQQFLNHCHIKHLRFQVLLCCYFPHL
jgi:hypothetical protein